MRRWVAISALAVLAGAGTVHARSHGHRSRHGLHALSQPGPSEARVHSRASPVRSASSVARTSDSLGPGWLSAWSP